MTEPKYVRTDIGETDNPLTRDGKYLLKFNKRECSQKDPMKRGRSSTYLQERGEGRQGKRKTLGIPFVLSVQFLQTE